MYGNVDLNKAVATIERAFGPLEQISIELRKEAQHSDDVLCIPFTKATATYSGNPGLAATLNRLFDGQVQRRVGLRVLYWLLLVSTGKIVPAKRP